jgi:hypothetical protein
MFLRLRFFPRHILFVSLTFINVFNELKMILYHILITFEAFVNEKITKIAILKRLFMLINFFHNIEDKLFFILSF